MTSLDEKESESESASIRCCNDPSNEFVYVKGFGPELYQVELLKASMHSFKIKRRHQQWRENETATSNNFVVWCPATRADLDLLCLYFDGRTPLETIAAQLRDYLALNHEQEIEATRTLRKRMEEIRTAITSPRFDGNGDDKSKEKKSSGDREGGRGYVDQCLDDILRSALNGSTTISEQRRFEYVASDFGCHLDSDCALLSDIMLQEWNVAIDKHDIKAVCAVAQQPQRRNEYSITVHFDAQTLERWQKQRQDRKRRLQGERDTKLRHLFEEDTKRAVPSTVAQFWRQFCHLATRAPESGAFDHPFEFRIGTEIFGTVRFMSQDDPLFLHDRASETERLFSMVVQQLVALLREEALIKVKVMYADNVAANEKAETTDEERDGNDGEGEGEGERKHDGKLDSGDDQDCLVLDASRDWFTISIDGFNQCSSFARFAAQCRQDKVDSEVTRLVDQAYDQFCEEHKSDVSTVATQDVKTSTLANSNDTLLLVHKAAPKTWIDQVAVRKIESLLRQRLASGGQPNLQVTARFHQRDLVIRVWQSQVSEDKMRKLDNKTSKGKWRAKSIRGKGRDKTVASDAQKKLSFVE